MRQPLPIARVRIPKAADLLADQLRAQILSGEWAVGAQLPPERELAGLAGLSRASVREALRILEMQGLIATRTGRGGGSVVCRPTRERLEQSVTLFIRGHRVRSAALLEAREALERVAAGLAAIHRTAEDLVQLDALQKSLAAVRGDNDRFLRLNFDWHLAVVHASHNEMLVGFVNAISRELFRFTLMDVFGSDDVQAATVRSHVGIMAALRAQDAAAAERRMGRHMRAYVQAAQGVAPSPVLEKRLLDREVSEAAAETSAQGDRI